MCEVAKTLPHASQRDETTLPANFGRRDELTVTGVYLGEELADDNPMHERFKAPAGAGSVIAVVATDAPLFPGQCKAFRPPGDLRPGKDRHQRLALLRRLVPRLLDC
jgi:hypothetical protein